MAGRFAYLLIAGGAVFGGMIFQGDIDLFGDSDQRVTSHVTVDRDDDAVDRVIDRVADKMVVRGDDGETADVDPATKRALAEAVAELVRAEGSLIVAKLDDDMPDAAILQAEQRRDLAQQAVDRLADNAKAETRGNRDALKQNIRDDVREGARDAVRGQ